ncbi:transcription factor mef2A [Condylostylus longicornis]|uniref:transcription factor mef2A n=1 Tax=Condylostylus longicornis TaxID=2530218 RepID=UPI00244E42CC|nr:transcription factor mef2A [Condylostylus longicornis]
MTDCSSIQGSTSSSSDAMSSRGGSNNSAASGGSGNSRIRIIRMIRPNSRRIILGPENNIGFGFAVRGGKEFSTGFFISKIDKGSEADLRGLRVGDQIIRVNGYHVDDAIHKELIQFISNQDRLTLKVRGVGMLPIKEKTLDPLTWHIVPRHALATTLNALDEQMSSIGKDVRIVLKVAPKTKLGLGICKGPEWKPGIFVQFTKDFSVARESGLRPGDQILTCNSIDFSDVLFSEAVAVMKSSNILEMIVRTGAGLDLFPGESSGYNSSASSITGDQSPCWADQSAKRLSMVREEPILSQTKNQWIMDGTINNKSNLDRRKTVTGIPNSALNQAMLSSNGMRSQDNESNKTIIQLSDNGTLINNTIVSNGNNIGANDPLNGNNVNKHGIQQKFNDKLIVRPNIGHLSSSMSNFIAPDYKAAAAAATTSSATTNQKQNAGTNQQPNEANGNAGLGNKSNNNNKIADICFVSRQSETKTVIVEVHRSDNDENLQLSTTNSFVNHQQNQGQQQQQNLNNYSDISNSNNNSGHSIYGKIQSQQSQQQNNNNTVCTRPQPPMMPLSSISNGLINSKTQSAIGVSPTPSFSSSSLSSSISPAPNSQTADIMQNPGTPSSGVSSMTSNGGGHERSPSISSSIISSGGTSLSSAISEELRKRKERLSQNPNQKTNIDECVANLKQQQQQSKRIGNPSLGVNAARHNALMDEFKAAHRRMFRNGFNETEMERQEELKKTTIMRDETDHRSPPPPPPPKIVANHKSNCAMINGNINGQQNGHHQHQHYHHNGGNTIENGGVNGGINNNNGINGSGSKTEYGNGNHNMSNGINGGQFPTPPPPPQFANKPPMGKKIFASINAFNAANNHNQNGNQNGHNELHRTISQNYHTNNNNTEIPPNVPPPPPPPPLPQSPIPDYDSIISSPSHTLKKNQHTYNKHTNGCNGNMSTLGRVAASEIAKANGDMAELESIDSYQLLNPSSPTPKPPSAYFVPPNSGPPTMKKSNRPVSVTIGEYGASKSGGRKEPSKFDFISSRSGSNSPNDLSSPMSSMSPTSFNGKDENVSHMLRSELELTLSRSNLKKRHDINGTNNNNNNTVVQYNNGIYQNGSFQHNGDHYNNNSDYHNGNNHQNGCTKIQNGANNNNRNIAYQSNSIYQQQQQQHQSTMKQPLSSNVEKITNMLQNINGNGNIYETTATLNGMGNNGNTIDKNSTNNNNNNNGANSTRVTISLPNNTNNKIELRKTDSNSSTGTITSTTSAPSNGILKNSINSMINGGSNRSNYGDKSITFGN